MKNINSDKLCVQANTPPHSLWLFVMFSIYPTPPLSLSLSIALYLSLSLPISFYHTLSLSDVLVSSLFMFPFCKYCWTFANVFYSGTNRKRWNLIINMDQNQLCVCVYVRFMSVNVYDYFCDICLHKEE